MENLKTNKTYYIHSVIVFLFMILFRFIPPAGGITSLGMELLGIFLGALWGWIFVDMIWPSAVAMVFLGFSAYCDSVGAAFNLAFGNPVVQQILWLLIMAAILTTTGLAKWLANVMISWKITKGRPWVLSMLIIFISFICSAFQVGFAGLLLCWNFIYAICEKLEIKKHTKWPNMMIVGCAFAGCLGASVMPYFSGTIATYGYLMTASNNAYSYSYVGHMFFGIIYTMATLAVFFLLCRFIVRPDMQPFKRELEIGQREKLTGEQKIAITATIGMIIVLLLPSIFPGTALAAFLNRIGVAAIVLLTICTVCFLRKRNGKPVFTFKQLADAGLLWQMVFMVATAMTIGSALVSADTGISTMLSSALTSLFVNKSPFFFACIFALAALILTNFINNAVVGAIMIPIMYSISGDIGVNPVAMCTVICFTSNLGMFLPNACPYAALTHGNKDWISSKEIMLHSLVGILALGITTVIVGVPLANIIM